MAGEIGHDAQKAEFHLPARAFQTGFFLVFGSLSEPSTSVEQADDL